MKKIIKTHLSQICTIIFLIFFSCKTTNNQYVNKESLVTQFEKSNGTQTPEYHNIIDYYKNLTKKYSKIQLFEVGNTDSGEPLHVAVYSNTPLPSDFNRAFNSSHTLNTILINNGIHPGESDGIDASMLLLRDLAEEKIKAPDNTTIAIIPVYNIGGALNRNTSTRTNQNGPEEHGFRGNARNYDLNRDFIKADTKNAQTFTHIFRTINPQLFIDTHVSNGADYQYTLTHLFTQHNKLGGEMGEFLNNTFMPQLQDSLAAKTWDITPYVNVFNTQPEIKGFTQFMDYPRYSTGYAALFNTLGMMVETHMLKPYKQRVEGTYELMKSFIEIADSKAEIINALHSANNNITSATKYPIQWAIDSSRTTTLQFKGYEGNVIKSEVTGFDRLQFDRTKPFTRPTSYYNYFKPTAYVSVPAYYIIPKGQWQVLNRLKLNKITMQEMKQDTLINAEVYHISTFQTRKTPYEGHYLHYNTEVAATNETVTCFKGDFLVPTNQEAIRYLLETLEPSAIDSFFNWNFFDTILQQKEGFSPYVWEEKAQELLNSNPEIKKTFEAKKATDKNFANNWYAQLDWLHKQSPNYESAHLRYPIIRVRG